MPRKNYPMLKKICCFFPVSLAMKTLSRSNAQFGGYWHFILDSVPETKAESLNGETLFFTKKGETGNEVLIWRSERGSRTRRGNGDARAFYNTAQATNNERYPVRYYKKFRSHRPAEMNNADSPFYLAINYQRRADNSIWYLKTPLGKNEIGNS